MNLNKTFKAAATGLLMAASIGFQVNAQGLSNEQQADVLKNDFYWILGNHLDYFVNEINPQAPKTNNLMSQPDTDKLETCYTLFFDGGLGVNFEHDDVEQIDSYYFAEKQELASTTYSTGDYYDSVQTFLDANPALTDTDNLDLKVAWDTTRIGCFNTLDEAFGARKDVNYEMFKAHNLRIAKHVKENIERLAPKP